MRERLKNMSLYTEELEKRNSSVGHQMSEMQENLDVQLNEISRERRARQRTEDEVLQLQEVLASKTNDLEVSDIQTPCFLLILQLRSGRFEEES